MSSIPGSEVAREADFSAIRYGQCWEDADALLEALDVRPGHTVLSIASAGDNTLALLGKGPARVVALDLSPAQLALLELRVAAYRALEHPQLLQLVGSTPGARPGSRAALYRRCRPALSPDARRFWDTHPAEIDRGIAGAGRFEHYLALFRKRVLPLAHGRARVDELLAGGRTIGEREEFFRARWDSWRWRAVFRLFFSRTVMGRLGRDPRFFRYAEGDVAGRLLTRARHALTRLDPAANPYLQWILAGRHLTALPYALRPENVDVIRANLARLEWRRQSVEDYLATAEAGSLDGYNLSDIGEYMSPGAWARLLGQAARAGRPGARLAYWNLFAPRSRPAALAGIVEPLEDCADRLHRADKAFFYSRFVVERIVS